MVVPMPNVPELRMVSFAESLGPITVDEAVLFVRLEPKADAPEPETKLR